MSFFLLSNALRLGEHGRSAARKNLKDPGFEVLGFFFFSGIDSISVRKNKFFLLQGEKITLNNFRWSASGGAFVKKKYIYSIYIYIFTLTAVSTR